MYRSILKKAVSVLLLLCLVLPSFAQAATWTSYVYMHFYANGGKFSDGKKIKDKTYSKKMSTGDLAYIECVIPDFKPTRSGYTFDHWAPMFETKPISGKIYDIDELTSSYVSAGRSMFISGGRHEYLVARWVPNYYPITYKSAGEEFKIAAKYHDQDTTIITDVPERDGYDFQGWDTSSKATKAVYKPGDPFTKNSKTTLYAVWKAHTYTVEFDANGGTSAPKALTKTHDKKLTVPKTKPVRTNFVFQGWAESPDAFTPDFKVGDALPDRNIKLYAVWSPALAVNSITISGDTQSEGGQILREDIYLNLKTGVKYLDILITYPSLLKCKWMTMEEFPSDLYIAERNSGDDRVLEVTGYCEEGYKPTGVSFLARLEFEVESNEAHPFGEYTISVSEGTNLLTTDDQVVTALTLGSQKFTYLPYSAKAIEIISDPAVDAPAQLSVAFTPENTTDQRIKWSVSDPAIATIDENGLLTPIRNGTVTVTAETMDGTGLTFEKEFTISGQKAAITGIDSDFGALQGSFDPAADEYTVYFLDTQSSCDIAFTFEDGTLLCEGYGYCPSGMKRTFDVEGDSLTLTFVRSADNLDDSTFKVTFVRRSVDEVLVHRLTLPETLLEIEAEAFRNTPVQMVTVGSYCEKIGSKAFADCADLMLIVLPASVTAIAADAFAGCHQQLTIKAPAGSPAQTFAQQQGFLFAPAE